VCDRHVPRALLPLRDRQLRELTATGFSPQDPYGGLVSSLARELTRHLGAYDSARDARIGTAFLDLLSLAAATRLDRVRSVPAESRQTRCCCASSLSSASISVIPACRLP
jgi:hypothetical protein